MTDPPSNPYASPKSLPADYAQCRPIGTVILAILLLMFGMASGGGGIIRFVEIWSMDPSLLPVAECLKFAHFGILAIASVGASIGLLSGHRSGWWVAITFCYFGFVTFTLFPVVRRGVSQGVLRTVIAGAIFGLYWFYLQRRNVLAYFGQREPQRWRVHVGLFVLSVIVVFGLGIW